MKNVLYEIVCAKFGHKIENCPYLAQISCCVECPYARYLKRDYTIKQEEKDSEEKKSK